MGRWAAAELISEAIAGAPQAADRLIETIWPGCFRLATAVVGDWNLAQDAAQEACILVHAKIVTLRSTEAFDSWLYRILIRECARLRRKHAPDVHTIHAHVFGGERTAVMDVWRALAALPSQLREVAVLFYIHDLKSDDIASILRVPHGTVRSRLSRARDQLRASLGDYNDGPQTDTREAIQHA